MEGDGNIPEASWQGWVGRWESGTNCSLTPSCSQGFAVPPPTVLWCPSCCLLWIPHGECIPRWTWPRTGKGLPLALLSTVTLGKMTLQPPFCGVCKVNQKAASFQVISCRASVCFLVMNSAAGSLNLCLMIPKKVNQCSWALGSWIGLLFPD